jgi:subtilisin family serine protease
MAKYVAPWVIVLCICGAATYSAQVRSTFQAEALGSGKPPRPMPGSPLVASADRLFAIASDQHHILVSPAAVPATWQVFAGGSSTFGRIAGLGLSDNGLYLTDQQEERVFRVDIKTRQLTFVYSGRGPLRSPGSIAVARDVFVVDDSNGKLYRLRDENAQEVPLGSDKLVSPLSLTGAGDDLLIASPAGILELRGIGRYAGDRAPNPAQQAPIRKAAPSSEFVFAVQKRDFPEITKPSRIAIWKGIVYVVDDVHQAVFAFGRDDQRPVKLVRESSRSCSKTEQSANKTYCIEFSSSSLALAVNENDLFLLTGDTLTRSPRPVPVEVVLPPSSVSEAMTDVYAYLQEKRLLATREVALEKNVEATLKDHGVLLAAYPKAFTPLLCGLNPGLCTERQEIKLLQAGRKITVPDLPYESYVDAIEVTLDGKESLEQIARRNIRSPEFSAWVTEPRLRELNDPKGKNTPLRDLPPGRYLSPIEYVRYLVPAYAADARSMGALKRLEGKYPGLQVQSLEERPAKAADAAAPGVTDPIFEPLKSNYSTMLEKIGYEDPNKDSNAVRVGIAEGFIDQENPDFENAWLQTGTNPVPAGAGASANAAYRIKSFAEDNDHGTMVAALVGARKSQFDLRGLAPRAMLLSLRSGDPAIEADIRDAFLRTIRIFNISAHYGVGTTPQGLQRTITRYTRSALFVVAAGNDAIGATGEICADISVFPACWHDRKNVIVVTATRSDGTTMLTAEGDKKGANWSATAVHLAAPGEGYHAAGTGKSYVPARGSSFATPLVTAAAALLYAQNVIDPWVIKQRLIATADPQPGLAGKVFAGRINFKRALTDTGFGVLVRQTKNAQGTVVSETRERITVDSGDIVVTPVVGNNKTIPATALRRVHVYGNGYRIVYVEDEQIKILEGASFPSSAASKFRAQSADGSTRTFDLIDYVDYIAMAPLPES